MKRSLKTAASRGLTFLLRPVSAAITGLRRLWAFSVLAAAVKPPVDASVVILGPAEVHGTGNIHLGRDLMLYRDLYLETQHAGRIAIGDGVVVSRGTHIVSFSQVTIGDGTMIGEYVSIRDANHIYGKGDIRHSGHNALPIRIGRNVWIGRGVAILPGVSIGDGAVVGANAVVTRNVLPQQVVAGIPARPLPGKESAA